MGLFRVPKCLLPAAALLALAARIGAADRHVADMSPLLTRVNTLVVSLKVLQYDPVELEKIGPDFKTTYSLKSLLLQYKQPGKIRLEGKSPSRGSAVLIYNGATRSYAIPKFRLRKTEDLTGSPGKRQSLLELGGLLSPETLTFMEGQFVKRELFAGQDASVYDMTYTGAQNGPRYRIWIDMRTRVTLKREWYDGENRLKATFTYFDPQELAPGLWIPTRSEIRNSDGALGAEVALVGARPNPALADSLFETAQ